MDPSLVRKLEERIERAIADIFEREDRKRLPVDPDRNVLHLMAKAAVTIYETAVIVRTDDGED